MINEGDSRIEWQNYSAARPINPRAEGTLERLLNNDLDQAKRELQQESRKERARVHAQIVEQHQAPELTEIKAAARGAISEFLDRIKGLKRLADGQGVDLSVPAVDRFLVGDEDENEYDEHDNEDLFTISIHDRSLQKKLNEASIECDRLYREVCEELDKQATDARRHILVAALTEEEQAVLNSVPNVDSLKQRLQLPPAT